MSKKIQGCIATFRVAVATVAVVVVGTTVAGCGGGSTSTGQSNSPLETPDASVVAVETTPNPLTATGGRIALTFNVYRRGGSYLTADAAPPSFAIKDASGNTVEEHNLTLEQRYPAETGRPSEDNSGTYSGTFTAPANTTTMKREYRIVVTIPQTNGEPFRKVLPEDNAVLSVPPPPLTP